MCGVKETIKEELENGILFEIPVKNLSFTNNIGMIYNENYLTVAAKKFLEML